MGASRVPRGGDLILVPEDTFLAMRDAADAFLALEVSPTGLGKLVVNGGKAYLQLDLEALRKLFARKPLEPYDASVGTTLKVSFIYGTISGKELDDYGPVTITATTYFYAKLTVDGSGAPVSLELDQRSTLRVIADDDTATVHYVYLGKAVVAGGALQVKRNLEGSQNYERCGYTGDFAHTNWLT